MCLASKGSVSWAYAARGPPSEMRYSTRPQYACGISQSPWTSCCPPCHSKSDKEDAVNADVHTTTVADGAAVITLGSAGRIYFDAEMGDALTEALDGLAGDTNVRVVVVTGGAPGYFNRHFSIPALIEIAEFLRASGRQ